MSAETLQTAEELQAELTPLTLAHFDETTAYRLGAILARLAQEGGLPVVINIRNGSRTFFHAAMPGSVANNDNWARRKSNLALIMGKASMVVTRRFAAIGRGLDYEGLSGTDCALSGGAVPVIVQGTGMVAVCTVSGLPELEDHRLVVKGLRALIAETSPAG